MDATPSSTASSHSLDEILAHRRDRNGLVVDVNEPQIKVVIFTLNGQHFAFPGRQIHEILNQQTIFFIPGCPASLKGVINLRSNIVSVLDLALLVLNNSGGESNQTSHSILVAEGDNISSGLWVEQVVDVVDINQSAIHPPLATLPEQLKLLVSGEFTCGKQSVVLLDADTLLHHYRQQQA
ncbi:MAG: purine-binding chemotaxis protein CheW [Gammaproteobacteria bacterium]|nr:purine-binding chemotaxis protein CheW [Gammaproteobacteria bacterium]